MWHMRFWKFIRNIAWLACSVLNWHLLCQGNWRSMAMATICTCSEWTLTTRCRSWATSTRRPPTSTSARTVRAKSKKSAPYRTRLPAKKSSSPSFCLWLKKICLVSLRKSTGRRPGRFVSMRVWRIWTLTLMSTLTWCPRKRQIRKFFDQTIS